MPDYACPAFFVSIAALIFVFVTSVKTQVHVAAVVAQQVSTVHRVVRIGVANAGNDIK